MRNLIAISSVFLLSGCFLQGNLGELRELNPQAEDFGSSLASEYLSYGDSESEQGRLITSEHFAQKGVKASKGKLVEPDPVSSSLSEPLKAELTTARSMLLILLSDDMKEAEPQKAAHAQLLFDCWEHQAEKGTALAPCADEFKSTIGDLQTVAEDFPGTKAKNYVIAFPGQELELSDAQLKQIASISRKLKAEKNYTLSLESYAGADEDERQSGQEQVGVVKNAFMQNGIPEIRINAKVANDKAVYLSGDVTPVAQDSVKVTVRIFVLKGRHT